MCYAACTPILHSGASVKALCCCTKTCPLHLACVAVQELCPVLVNLPCTSFLHAATNARKHHMLAST